MPSFASSIPASGAAGPNSPPSSAAVLEYVCLFTHDLRRKQKRWQDGRLKFHTFNKRVMVYDERGNFIGDMHWSHDDDFGEGEELSLDRGGVMVQVAECVGRREQDLSELIDKRAKEKEERQLKAAARINASLSARPTPRAPQPDHFQVRHRPLHQLIGTPTGHHGRALAPTESPFEQRHSPVNPPHEQNSRAVKRRKFDDVPSKSGYAQALFGATLSLSATPMSSAPVRSRALPARSPPVEAEVREPSREQEALREQPKSSLHFNSKETRKKEIEPTANKQDQPKRQREPHSLTEDISATRGNQNPHERQPAPLRPNRIRHEVIPVDDDEEEEIDAHDHVQSQESRQPVRPTISSRPVTEQASSEKSRKRKSRLNAGTPQEVSDSEPRRAVRSKNTRKSKPVDRGQPHPEQDTASLVDIAEQRSQPHPISAKKQPAQPTKKPDEPRTELRIKSRKKRGLLMMAEPVTIAPRETAQPSLPEPRTSSKPRPVDAQAEEDNPFVSSPPRPNPQLLRAVSPEQRSNSLMTESMTDKDVDVHVDVVIDDDSETDVPLHAAHTRTKKSKRPQNRRQTILDDDNDDEEEMMLDEPRKRRNRRSGITKPDTPPQEEEDPEKLEAPKEENRRIRKPKKIREVEEETAALNSGEDSSTTSKRRDPARRTAQRRRRSKEDTPIESAIGSEFDETDEVRAPPKKRRRSEEMPQVPAGPRLARLSKKGVKSREVIGFRLDDAAMFRGLGAKTGPPIQKPAPQQDVEMPARVITTESSSRVPSRKNSLNTTPQPDDFLPAPRVRITDPHQGIKPPEKQAVARDITPEQPTEPSGAPQAPSNNVLPIADDLPIDQRATDPTPASPVPADTSKGGVEVDLLEGMTLSPVVLSPVKPTLPTTLPPQELPDTANVPARVLEKTPPVETKPESAPLPMQLPPSPPAPERRTINGLGRQSSIIGALQARDPPAEPPRPEPPREAAASAVAVAAAPAAAKSAPPVARIMNPATRGRKAALKSHAAGQAPQPVLPAISGTLAGTATVIYIERTAPPPGAEQPLEPEPEPRAAKKKKMTYPGFAPARQSGPWSREAFDLLEKPRPF